MKHLKKFYESSHLEWRLDLQRLLGDLTQDIQDEGFELHISDETKSVSHRPSFRIRIKYQQPIIYHETDVEKFKQMNEKIKVLMDLVTELIQRLLHTGEFTLESASLNGDNSQFLIIVKGKEIPLLLQ